MNHLPTLSLCFFLCKLGRVLPTGKLQGLSEKAMGARRWVGLIYVPLSTADGEEDSRLYQLTDLPSYESLPTPPSQIRDLAACTRLSTIPLCPAPGQASLHRGGGTWLFSTRIRDCVSGAFLADRCSSPHDLGKCLPLGNCL